MMACGGRKRKGGRERKDGKGGKLGGLWGGWCAARLLVGVESKRGQSNRRKLLGGLRAQSLLKQSLIWDLTRA